MTYDYLVVGAGLFGSVFANQAAKAGKKVLVIDKRKHIGGNCYTKNCDGINIHVYGAHIFHTNNREVWDFVNQFAEFNNYINSPVAVYKNELYNLPFNMNTFSKMWGIKTPKEAMDKIESQKAMCSLSGEPKNLEEQALSLVGKDVYEKLVKGYTEKQWGRDCVDLPAFIIKRLPLRFTYDNNYFSDRYQGIPIGGYTGIFEKLLDVDGIEVRLETNFNDVKGGDTEYENVIYTGPIDEFFDYEKGRLHYRSLKFETVKLKENNYQGNAVVNYTERSVPFTRIIEHKHFEYKNPDEVSGTYITREFPSEWKPGTEPYYPINDEENTALYEQYRALSVTNLANEIARCKGEVIFGGRLGTYTYYDMDKIVEAALNLSKRKFAQK